MGMVGNKTEPGARGFQLPNINTQLHNPIESRYRE